jgi:hypothetical protein
MNTLIQFQFKGERTYIQGGDLYDKVTALLCEDEYINDISFRQLTNKNCYLKSTAEDTDIVAAIIKTNIQQYFLVESTTTASERYSFDEDNLVSGAIVNSNVVTMQLHQSYSVIENIIAMTKKLNYSVNPEVNGKWLFGQLKLNIPFPSVLRAITIESTRRIPNRFSENAITIDGKQYGTIIFIVGKS